MPKRKLNVLDEIVASTSATLPALRARSAELERNALDRPPPADFITALRGERVALLAEVKRRSPSAGAINPELDPVAQALAYQRGGAAAVSVLTDGPFFGGSLEDLRLVAEQSHLPLLRKDFILDELQLLEARAAGASAALLIVRILEQSRLVQLLNFTHQIGLNALVEAHNQAELDRALDTDARVIGINARDLDSFMINCKQAWELLARIPTDRLAVAESGMAVKADVERAAAAGADVVLVGGALAMARDPARLAAELSGVTRRGR